MIQRLQSPWIASALGTILFLVTMVLSWHPHLAPPPSKDAAIKTAGPSWTFHNPEVDQLVTELKREKESVAEKEKQLSQLSARLQAERAELNQVTQTVHQLETDFDHKVTRVEEQEMTNLKRLAKVYAGMAPDNAVKILKEMDESTLVKILVVMKDSEAAGLLEAFAKQGEAEAKQAATLTERLRLSLSKSKSPAPAAQ